MQPNDHNGNGQGQPPPVDWAHQVNRLHLLQTSTLITCALIQAARQSSDPLESTVPIHATVATFAADLMEAVLHEAHRRDVAQDADDL